MYQYVGYYHPFTSYPYTSQNIVRYPCSYPYAYQAPYINHPLYQVQQQNRPTYDINGFWNTKYGSEVGKKPQIPLDMLLSTYDSDKVSGYYWREGGPINGWLQGKIYGDTVKGTWTAEIGFGPFSKGTFEFKFAPDGKSFTGLWDYGTTAPGRYPWNGTFKEPTVHR
ncbi:hypothetical protein ACQKCU_00100 [Heyndrickxia sporothermodurans]